MANTIPACIRLAGITRLLGLARRALFTIAIFLAVTCVPATRAVADPPESNGPRNLLITYRSEPANRPAFRTYLLGEGRAPMEKLKRESALQSYQILFKPFVSSGTWDAMVVLTFARYADTRRWQEIEQTMPGGLTAKGLHLANPVDTYFADLTWSGVSNDPGSERDGVYYVIPYEYTAADSYRKYVEGYVIPQVKGWMREGVLSGYRIFMNRFPVGPAWDALFVYQYRNLEAFGRREEVLQKVRQTLVSDPVWKEFSDIKQTLRSESENTLSEMLLP
jgi:hypothetical protein